MCRKPSVEDGRADRRSWSAAPATKRTKPKPASTSMLAETVPATPTPIIAATSMRPPADIATAPLDLREKPMHLHTTRRRTTGLGPAGWSGKACKRERPHGTPSLVAYR